MADSQWEDYFFYYYLKKITLILFLDVSLLWLLYNFEINQINV